MSLSFLFVNIYFLSFYLSMFSFYINWYIMTLTEILPLVLSLLCVRIHLFSSDWQRHLWELYSINSVSVCSFNLCVPFLCRPLHFSVRVSSFSPIFYVIHTSVLSFPRGYFTICFRCGLWPEYRVLHMVFQCCFNIHHGYYAGSANNISLHHCNKWN